MTLTPGRRIGAYGIVGLLGAGGMGEVSRACDPRLGRDVAIKVLPEWRRDGRELFFRGRGGSLMAAPIAIGGSGLTAGTPSELFAAAEPFTFLIPSADGQRFLIDVPAEDPAPITILLNWAGFRN